MSCESGGIGRRTGLRIQPWKQDGSSSLPSRTIMQNARKGMTMQVTVENKSSVKKTLHIKIPGEKVSEEIEAAYENLKRTVKLKGFRPGKTPVSVLKSIYKKKINDQVSSKLINDTVQEAFKETGLKIAGGHEIDPPELDEGGPYSFDVTVDVFPDIEDIDFKGIKIKKNLYSVTDADIEGQLSMLQKHVAQSVKIDDERPVEMDDIAIIDYEGFKNGQPFGETQKTENFSCKLGENKLYKEFEENIVGMTPGQTREIEINFPTDYMNKNLAGLDIVFKATLKEIRKQVLPEINDEFAEKFGAFQTLDELKKEISNNFSDGYEKRTEHEMNEDVFKALIEKTSFDLPEASVKRELESIVREAEQSLSAQDMSFEDAGFTRESLEEKYRETARKKVRRFLLLSKIIEQEKIELSDEELENGFKQMGKKLGYPVEQIKAQYSQNEDGLDFFKQTLLEKAALQLVIDNGIIEEIKPEQVLENQK